MDLKLSNCWAKCCVSLYVLFSCWQQDVYSWQEGLSKWLLQWPVVNESSSLAMCHVWRDGKTIPHSTSPVRSISYDF